MITNLSNRHLLLIIFLTIDIFISSCSDSKDDKMPITTTSDTALNYYLQARDLSERVQGQESIEFFKRSVVEDTNFALGYLNLAFVQPNAKGFFENLNKAIALSDKISEGERLWILGTEAGVNGFQLKQRKYFKKLVDLYPNDERVHNLLGNHYFGLQEYELAIEEYDQALKLNPGFSTPYNQLGYSLRFLGNYDKAEKVFKKYIELIPNDPNPYDSYAELLMKVGKFDKSIETYKKALELNSNFVPSHIGIASNLNFKGNHVAAREQLNHLHSIARNDGERRAAHFAKVISYVDERDMVKALEELQKQYALSDKINDEAAMTGDLNLMGNILLEHSQFEEAMLKFEDALNVAEESILSEEVKNNIRRGYLYNTARVDLKQGDFISAKKKSEAFHEQAKYIKNPFQYRLSHGLEGMIALEEKDYDTAIKEFRQANQQNPYNFYRIALALREKGNIKKATKFCEKAAFYNVVNNINYAYIRIKAVNLLDTLK